MINKSKIRKFVLLLLLLVVLVTFLILTNPYSLPVGILIVPVLLVFFIGFIGTQLICALFRLFPNHPKKQRSLGATVATMFAIALVLGSSGGIVLTDVVIIVLILVIALIYITNF